METTKPHYMSVAAIATKYHPETGRISARRLDHKPGSPIVYLNEGTYSSRVEAHGRAAELLIAKMGVDWVINPVGCFDQNSERHIWVMDIERSHKKES